MKYYVARKVVKKFKRSKTFQKIRIIKADNRLQPSADSLHHKVGSEPLEKSPRLVIITGARPSRGYIPSDFERPYTVPTESFFSHRHHCGRCRALCRIRSADTPNTRHTIMTKSSDGDVSLFYGVWRL